MTRLACSGIRGEGGAQHANEHTKPAPGGQAQVICTGCIPSEQGWAGALALSPLLDLESCVKTALA